MLAYTPSASEADMPRIVRYRPFGLVAMTATVKMRNGDEFSLCNDPEVIKETLVGAPKDAPAVLLTEYRGMQPHPIIVSPGEVSTVRLMPYEDVTHPTLIEEF